MVEFQVNWYGFEVNEVVAQQLSLVVSLRYYRFGQLSMCFSLNADAHGIMQFCFSHV